MTQIFTTKATIINNKKDGEQKPKNAGKYNQLLTKRPEETQPRKV